MFLKKPHNIYTCFLSLDLLADSRLDCFRLSRFSSRSFYINTSYPQELLWRQKKTRIPHTHLHVYKRAIYDQNS